MRGRLLECYRSGVRDRFICCDRWPFLPSKWCDGCTNICTHLASMGSDIEVARAQLATAPDRDQHRMEALMHSDRSTLSAIETP